MTDRSLSVRPAALLAGVLTMPFCAALLPAQDPPKPVRFNDHLNLPQYLRFSGQHRFRVESLNGQFRDNRPDPMSPNVTRDNEDQLALRTIARIDYTRENWGAVFEALDGRMLFAEDDSFANTTTVNTWDVLQASASYSFNDGHRVTVGRWTKDLGSRRLIARNKYRNTINSFNGVRWDYANDDGYEAGAFWSLPTIRRPNDRMRLVDNEHDFDTQTTDYQFFGVHATKPVDENSTAQVYLLGLTDDRGMNDDRLWTTGFRYHRPSRPGHPFAEFEGTYQFGERGMTDVNAHFVHGSIGYQCDCSMKPRVRLAIDIASGNDVGDDDYGRYNTLFGARRFEYGPTGIYGAIGRRNLISPELRVDFKPSNSTWIMVGVRDVRLHSGSDAWVEASDDTGDGRHVGVQTECRLRWEPCPKNVRIECGAAYLAGGDFRDTSASGRSSDTSYFFAETIFTF